ncbi:MAG: 3-dehydroquinate synthase [Lentisphaeria bacterium]
MQTLMVELGARRYPILLGRGMSAAAAGVAALRDAVAGRRCLLVADSTVAPLHAAALRQALEAAGAAACETASFPAGEGSKTLDTLAALYRAAARFGLDRGGVAVALGGGVAGDLAGFFAATWMRGIAFVQAPTSLLALVDSSVGGKTGVDLPEGKNLVGAFHQPRLVLGDLAWLDTLPACELRNGLAEVVKYGAGLDAAFFAELERDADALLAREPAVLERVVARCCAIKAAVVAADEHEGEGGRRALLNYGHTFGHAVETLTGYAGFRHGEAVAVGMVLAATLAARLGRCPPELPARTAALLARLGLPTRLPADPAVTPEAMIAVMGRDKKTRAGRLRLVLPGALGETALVPLDDLAALRAALEVARGEP